VLVVLFEVTDNVTIKVPEFKNDTLVIEPLGELKFAPVGFVDQVYEVLERVPVLAVILVVSALHIEDAIVKLTCELK
jgi:hypothetical protein